MPSSKAKSVKRRLFGNDEKEESPQQSSAQAVEDSGKAPQVATVLDTPQKKRRVDDYFSPKRGRAIVTPEKDEELDIASPPSTKKPRVVDLMDKVSTRPRTAKRTKAYVPEYIHKNLGYQREGTASLSAVAKKTFELVQEHYVIPDDLEQNRSYGPLSGTCFEERAIRAYNLSLLKPMKTDVEICSHCSSLGHKRNDCPQLI